MHRQYYGPDHQEATFPLPRPRPKPLEPLDGSLTTFAGRDKVTETVNSHPMGSLSTLPPPAKIGPPRKSAGKKKWRLKKGTRDTHARGMGAANTTSMSSTLNTGVEMSSMTNVVSKPCTSELAQGALKVIVLRAHDDTFLNFIPRRFPYHRFMMFVSTCFLFGRKGLVLK